jgi:hypothetical protein
MDFNVKIVDNFLTEEECLEIVSFVQAIPEWERDGGEQSFWDNRALSDKTIYNLHNKDVGLNLLSIRDRIGKVLEDHYKIQKIYPDLLSISRWFPGMELHPHIDDMSDVDREGTEWFHHREFGSVIYLNNNYSGGHTYYPQHGVEVVPKTGTLVIHPGNKNYEHGVTPIADGIRYTISSFWTQDQSFHDDWINR